MHLIQLLLPDPTTRAGPSRGKISIGSRRSLASRFNGVTAYLQAPTERLGRQGTKSDSDNIVILEVMTEEIDVAGWRDRRRELERRFRQDKVIIRCMPMALV